MLQPALVSAFTQLCTDMMIEGPNFGRTRFFSGPQGPIPAYRSADTCAKDKEQSRSRSWSCLRLWDSPQRPRAALLAISPWYPHVRGKFNPFVIVYRSPARGRVGANLRPTALFLGRDSRIPRSPPRIGLFIIRHEGLPLGDSEQMSEEEFGCGATPCLCKLNPRRACVLCAFPAMSMSWRARSMDP